MKTRWRDNRRKSLRQLPTTARRLKGLRLEGVSPRLIKRPLILGRGRSLLLRVLLTLEGGVMIEALGGLIMGLELIQPDREDFNNLEIINLKRALRAIRDQEEPKEDLWKTRLKL